jgi:hypothetical protein
MSKSKMSPPKLDGADMKQVAMFVLPILLVLSLDYMFQDFWDSQPPELRFFLFLGLLVATAWAYSSLLRRLAK